MAPLVYPRTVTGAFVASPDYDVYTINASSNFNITIPTPVTNGISYTFCRNDANSAFTVNLVPSSGTIGGLTSFPLAIGVSVTIVSFQGDWFVEGNNLDNTGQGAQMLIPSPGLNRIRGITCADNTLVIVQGTSSVSLSTNTGNYQGSMNVINLNPLDTWINVTYQTAAASGDYSGATTGITGITGPVHVASSTLPFNDIALRTALVVPAVGFTAAAPSSISVRILTQNPLTDPNPQTWIVRGGVSLAGIPNNPNLAPWMGMPPSNASFYIPLNTNTKMNAVMRNLMVQVKVSGGNGTASLGVNGPVNAPDPLSPSTLSRGLFVLHY